MKGIACRLFPCSRHPSIPFWSGAVRTCTCWGRVTGPDFQARGHGFVKAFQPLRHRPQSEPPRTGPGAGCALLVSHVHIEVHGHHIRTFEHVNTLPQYLLLSLQLCSPLLLPQEQGLDGPLIVPLRGPYFAFEPGLLFHLLYQLARVTALDTLMGSSPVGPKVVNNEVFQSCSDTTWGPQTSGLIPRPPRPKDCLHSQMCANYTYTHRLPAPHHRPHPA